MQPLLRAFLRQRKQLKPEDDRCDPAGRLELSPNDNVILHSGTSKDEIMGDSYPSEVACDDSVVALLSRGKDIKRSTGRDWSASGSLAAG
jgi:hypothetical protein